MNRNFWLMLLVVFAVALTMPISAQPTGQGDPAFRDNEDPEAEPGIQDQRPDEMGPQGQRPGMRPGMGPQGHGQRPGMRPGMGQQEGGARKGPMDPEMEKQMIKRNSIMTMAEAHKNLSYVYEQQGKIDEAVTELKNILTLLASEQETGKDQKRDRKMLGMLVPVYHEIARLYLQNNRTDDAEKIINEGITRFSTEDPAAASKLLLHLGEIYKNSNNLDKAAENYKRVIEMNQKILDQK